MRLSTAAHSARATSLAGCYEITPSIGLSKKNQKVSAFAASLLQRFATIRSSARG
jgi:hypothetical protein